jgi:hypothetical protein
MIYLDGNLFLPTSAFQPCLYFWDLAFKFIGSLLFGSQLVTPTVTIIIHAMKLNFKFCNNNIKMACIICLDCNIHNYTKPSLNSSLAIYCVKFSPTNAQSNFTPTNLVMLAGYNIILVLVYLYIIGFC